MASKALMEELVKCIQPGTIKRNGKVYRRRIAEIKNYGYTDDEIENMLKYIGGLRNGLQR